MRRSTLLVGFSLALLSLAACGGDATSPVRADAPPRRSTAYSLQVSISGPSSITNGWSCTWYVNVQDGTPPYTYWWSSTGMISEGPTDAEYWTGYKTVSTWGSHSVLVTDATGKQGRRSLIIQDSESLPEC